MTATDLEMPTLGSLSPSRAGDFLTCPLLYRFRAIDRLPERPSLAATRGTLVHATLERLFDLPPQQRTLERARAMVGPEWDRLVAGDPDVADLFGDRGEELGPWLDGAEKLVETYFALEDPRRLEPADRELFVETRLESGLVLRGYVDRLDVSPGGAMRIVDYKTGRAPGEGFEARAMFQMRFYALVLWRLHGTVPAMLQLLYLGSGEVLRYAPDEDDLHATERKLAAVWQAIATATETGDWRPRVSRLCDWCEHKGTTCPAWPVDEERVRARDAWIAARAGSPPRDSSREAEVTSASVAADLRDEMPSPRSRPEDL